MVAKEKPITDYQRLMKALYERTGPIPDGKAQGQAAKWLLEHYSVEEAVEVLDEQLGCDWRGGRVSLLTVKKEIGTFRARHKRPDAQPVSPCGEVFPRAEAEKLLNDLIEFDAIGFSWMIEFIRKEYSLYGRAGVLTTKGVEHAEKGSGAPATL